MEGLYMARGDWPEAAERDRRHAYVRVQWWGSVCALGLVGTAITSPDPVPMVMCGGLAVVCGIVAAAYFYQARHRSTTSSGSSIADANHRTRVSLVVVVIFVVLAVAMLAWGLADWFGWPTSGSRHTTSAVIDWALAAIAAAMAGLLYKVRAQQKFSPPHSE
jgi:hypothetical protein